MCEFHESTCNGFGDIWWTDNPIYFSSIDSGYCTLVYMLWSLHFGLHVVTIVRWSICTGHWRLVYMLWPLQFGLHVVAIVL